MLKYSVSHLNCLVLDGLSVAELVGWEAVIQAGVM